MQFKDAQVVSEAFCLAPASPEHSTLRWVGERETTLSVALRDGDKELALERFDVDIYAGGLLPEVSLSVQTDAAGRLNLDTSALPSTLELWAMVFFKEGEETAVGELWLQSLSPGQPAILCAGHLTEAGALGAQAEYNDDLEVRAFTYNAERLEVHWGLYAFEQGFVGGTSTLIQETSAIVSPEDVARGTLAGPGTPPSGIQVYGEAWLVDQDSGNTLDSQGFTPNWGDGGTILQR
jgi:hypothetical protein